MYTQKMVDDYEAKFYNYDGLKAYAQCKRQQVYLTQLWAKKYADLGVTFNSVHPGTIYFQKSNNICSGWAKTPGISALPGWFDKLDLRSPEQGADTIVWLCVCKKIEKESGKLFFDRAPRDIHMPLANTQSSEEEIQKLWDYCMKYKEKFETESQRETIGEF